jgi:hypothetical protein
MTMNDLPSFMPGRFVAAEVFCMLSCNLLGSVELGLMFPYSSEQAFVLAGKRWNTLQT